MTSLESRVKQELEFLVKFWSQSEGRDKFTKAIQYGSRLAAHLLVNDKLAASRFTDLMKITSDSRKIFRLGKSVNEYTKVQEILKSPKDQFTRITSAVSRAGFLFYWLYDNLVILKKINFIRTGDMKSWGKKASTFWAIGLVFGILLELYNLHQIEKKVEAAKVAEKPDSCCPDLTKFNAERRTCYINLAKNFGDLITATNGMELPHKIIGRPFSEGLIGLGGLTSALLTCYQMYPDRSALKK